MSRSLLKLLGSHARIAAVAAGALALGAGGALAATAPSGLQRLAAETGLEQTDLEQTEPPGPALGDEADGADGAAEEEQPAPDLVDEELTDGGEQPADEQPADGDQDEHDAEEQDAGEEDGAQDGDGPADQVAPPCPAGVTNHGQYVSGVARSTEPGPGHGRTVSAAARLGCTPAEAPDGADQDGAEQDGAEQDGAEPEGGEDPSVSGSAEDAQPPATRGRSAEAPGRDRAEQGAATGKGHGKGTNGKGAEKSAGKGSGGKSQGNGHGKGHGNGHGRP